MFAKIRNDVYDSFDISQVEMKFSNSSICLVAFLKVSPAKSQNKLSLEL